MIDRSARAASAPRRIHSSAAFAMAVAAALAAGCGDSGSGGAGGGPSTTTGAGSTGTGSGSNATSTGSACLGNDPNEPNDSFATPAFVNDAGSGLACGAAAVTGNGELADATDVDVFQIYTDSTTCAAPAPKLHVTAAGSVDVCFYIDACDTSAISPLICAGDTHGDVDTGHGITGCCGTIAASGTVTLPGAETCPDFNAKLYVKLENAAACSDYSFDVSL